MYRILTGDNLAKFKFVEAINYLLFKNNFLGEPDKICFDDNEFISFYRKYDTRNFRSFERKYTLKELFKLTRNVEGDTAELGVYYGASSELFLNEIVNQAKVHHMFDSWEGLSTPGSFDGNFWKKNDLNSSFKICKKNLKHFDKKKKVYYKGWIPDTFNEVNSKINFSFIHFDLDLYEPTKLGLEFFYNKLNRGGIIVFDDYTFTTCPGVKKAVDDFFENKKEEIICLPMSAFILKQ